MRIISNICSSNIIVSVLPLTPEYNYEYQYRYIEQLIENIKSILSERPYCIVADSSGALIAAAAIELTKKQKIPPPKRLILISHWLNLQLGHTSTRLKAKKDPWLDLTGLRIAAKKYVPSGTKKPHKISEFAQLIEQKSAVTIIYSKNDLLAEDAKC